MADDLMMWTIYDSPLDAPGKFVVRKFINRGGESIPTNEAWVGNSLDAVRAKVPAGLYRMPRFEADHPSVVETWM